MIFCKTHPLQNNPFCGILWLKAEMSQTLIAYGIASKTNVNTKMNYLMEVENMNNLIKNNNSSNSLNVVAKNFETFIKNRKPGCKGAIFSVALKNPDGSWSNMTQRVFLNGSIHIKVK